MVSRNLETRENSKRKTGWKPASLLPVPDMAPNVAYRWIRVGSQGTSDSQNVSKRFREGWVPVNAKDHPELQVMSDQGSRFTEGVEIGGLLLCRNSEASVAERRSYYEDRTRTQMNAVDNNYMRENDPRMPLYKPERRSRTTFGESE